MTEELLPCPFCGGEAKEMNEHSLIKFGCDKCDIKPHSYYQVSFPQWRDDAIAEWNTRAQPKMQKVDLDDMLINQRRSPFFEQGYAKAIGDIKAKYGDLYAEVE